MLWCLKRKKPQVRNQVPDDAQIADAQVDETIEPEGRKQNFPEGYKTVTASRFANMTVGANLYGRQRAGHVDWYVKKLIDGRAQYRQASVALGNAGFNVPWEVIGALHGLEASFDFNKQILNGQPWTRKTTWVPKNLGPWGSWMQSTVDGFIYEEKYNPAPRVWTVAGTALFFERWNGMGYWRMKKASPYLWSYTSAQQHGKYVSDGKYDPRAESLQVGAMAMLSKVGFFSA
jgi:lysozyme family protein